jgi:hypothetical protein
MAKYIANRDTLIAHESRVVKAGEVFETTFPKVKVNGKEVDMKLGDNIQPFKGKDESAGDSGDLA